MAIRHVIPFLALFLCAHGPSSCGPTDEEASRAVMFAGPIVFLAGMGLLRFLLWLWRKRKPVAVRWKPALVVLGVLVLGQVVSFIGLSDNAYVSEWYFAALVLMGTSFLTLLLVIWRIWAFFSPDMAFTWSYLPAAVLIFWPCPFMLFSAETYWDFPVVVFWIFPGYMGIVTGILLAILIIEIVVRIRLARRRQNEP
jgi:hypothetical protein